MAITWRTMNQPIAAGVGQLLYGAQQGLNQGFGALQKVLDQHNKTQQANWVNEKGNNTSDYLDAVQNLSADQAQDPTVQANLAALRSQFGYQVDANAIRGAVDQRVENLQKQGLQKIEFNDKTRIDAERDTVDAIASQYQQGNYAAGDQMREGQNFRDDAALSKLRVDAQRGYAGEQRAVNADGRAASAHALSQQVGRANLAWTNEQRAIARDEHQKEVQGDTLFNRTVDQYQQAQAAEAEQANKIALGYGFKVENGVPVIPDTAPQEVRDNLAKDLEAAGVGQLKSTTEMRKQLEGELRAAGLKPKDINTQMMAFDATMNRGNSLSAPDQAEVDAQKAAVTTAVTYATDTEKKRFADLQRTNQFLVGVDDPQLTPEDVVKSLKAGEFDPVFGNGSAKENILDEVNKINSKGLEVNGTTYQIPAPMLKSAILYAGDDWTSPEKGITDYLKSVITANPKAYADSIDALDDHKKALREINTAAIKQNSRIDTQSKAKAGIPYSTEKFLKTLRKERN